MYAAAGGASLASRQKRKNQAAQNVKNKALLQQGLKDKLAATRASDLAAPLKAQSRQFHNLPSTYLRTPQAQARKLSAGYTTQSRLLLPINESNSQNHEHSQQHHHHHHHHHHHNHPHHHHHHHHPISHSQSGGGGVGGTHHHPHFPGHLFHPQHVSSTSQRFPPNSPSRTDLTRYEQYQLTHNIKKSVTLPMVSQSEPTPPATPATPTAAIYSSTKQSAQLLQQQQQYNDDEHCTNNNVQSIQVPQDSIIVTPATPIASASPSPTPSATNQLERKCSFYRGKKLDAYEESFNRTTTIIASEDKLQQYTTDEYQTIYKMPNGKQKWATQISDEYCCCDSEHRHMEICTCDHVECSQGRAAWLERGRRCSVQENSASCHRRWVKRNRIHDSSLGGSSDDDDFLGVLRGPSSFANAFLYVGLGTIAIGLIIAFVGTGEKGFKTVELRLIGPSLIGIGLICCILRIFFCICPSQCISSSRRKLKKKNAKVDADHTTSLLRSDTKRVSIARGPQNQKPVFNDKDNPLRMETLRHIASTSLFLHSEKQIPSNSTVPTINEVDKPTDAPLEMKQLDSSTEIKVCNVSDDEEDDPNNITNIIEIEPNQVQRPSKLVRTRAPVNQSKTKDSDTILMETSLMILNQSPILPSVHQHSISTTAESSRQIFDSTSIQNQLQSTVGQSSLLSPLPPSIQQHITTHTPSLIESEIVLSPAKLGQ